MRTCHGQLAIGLAAALLAFFGAVAKAQELPRGAEGWPLPQQRVLNDPLIDELTGSIREEVLANTSWDIPDWADGFEHHSLGWQGDAEDLSALLHSAEALVAETHGADGRGMQAFVADNLDAAFLAWGEEDALDWGLQAVAEERRFIISAIFHGTWFAGAEHDWDLVNAAVGGRADPVRSAMLAYVQELNLAALSEGDEDRADRMAAIGFDLMQQGFVTPTAELGTRGLRLRAHMMESEWADSDLVHSTKRLMDKAGSLRAEGGLPDPIILDFLKEFADLAGDDRDERFVALFNEAMASIGTGLDGIAQREVDLERILLPARFSLAEVQAALPTGAALILHGTAEGKVQVFVVTREGYSWLEPLEWADEISRRTTDLLTGVDKRAGRGAVPLTGDDTEAGPGPIITESRWLYQRLLAPAEHLLEGKTRLLVSGQGYDSVGRVPFHILLVSDPASDDDWEDLDYLLRHASVSTLPTLEYLFVPIPADDRPATYLGLADAEFWKAPDAVLRLSATQDYSEFLRRMARLPETRGEVAAVAQLFPDGVDVLTGADATEAALYDLSREGRLREKTILHFATHGAVYQGGDGLAVPPLLALSALAEEDFDHNFQPERLFEPVPDGALTAGEVGYLDLDARLIILSACNTATALSYEGDGIGGLTAAFLGAGADRVLSTHWRVDSRAAVIIVTNLIARDPGLQGPSDALREVMLAELARGGRYAHPAWWAAFSLTGFP